jgi:ribosomal protein S18 acetylase RimI-like enzyme
MRTATASDTAAVRDLVERAYAQYVPRIGRRPGPMDDDYDGLVAAGEVSVLEDESGLVAILVLRAEHDHLLVDNVAVDPAHQGQGHGRRLLAYAEDEARRLGLPELRLYTHVKMTENIALYESLGWIEYERRAEVGFARAFFRKPVATRP